MPVTCEDVLKLDIAKQFKLLAGKKGVGKAIRWMYICQENYISPWVQGGELLFLTGIGIQRDEQSLVNLVEQCHAKNLAGIVILINTGLIADVPQAMIAIANKLDIPLITMPWEIPLVVISREVANLIMLNQIEQKSSDMILKDVLSGSIIDPNIIQLNLQIAGYKFGKYNRIVVVEIKSGIELSDYRFITFLKNIISSKLNTPIYCVEDNRIIAFVGTNSIDSDKQIETSCKSLLDEISNQIDSAQLMIGIGNNIDSMSDITKSYNQAVNAIIAKEITDQDKNIVLYNSIGILQLFFEAENIHFLKSYYKTVLNKLINYDKKNNTELVKTLDVFLQENCNIIKTAEKLFIHRNTLNYRINRIREIIQRNFENANDRNELYTAILAMKFSLVHRKQITSR